MTIKTKHNRSYDIGITKAYCRSDFSEFQNHCYQSLDRLKTFSIKTLLRFFNNNKSKTTTEKIINLFLFLNFTISKKEIEANNIEVVVRCYDGKIEDFVNGHYHLNLFLNRFLDYK